MKKRPDFVRLLQDLDDGAFVEGVSEELHRLLVSQRRRADEAEEAVKGELQLTIKLQTEPGGSTKFVATVKSKRPGGSTKFVATVKSKRPGPPGAAMACSIGESGLLIPVTPPPPSQESLPFEGRDN